MTTTITHHTRLPGEELGPWVAPTLLVAAIGLSSAGAALAYMGARPATPEASPPAAVASKPAAVEAPTRPGEAALKAPSATVSAVNPPSEAAAVEPTREAVKAPSATASAVNPPSEAAAPQPTDEAGAVAPLAEAAAHDEAIDDEATQGEVADCAPLFDVEFSNPKLLARPERPPKAQLKAVTAWMERHPEAVLTLTGHSDAVYHEHFNVRLSFMRARAVAAHLQAAGLSERRMRVRGLGAYQPREGLLNDDARNRRVTLSVTGAARCASPASDDATPHTRRR